MLKHYVTFLYPGAFFPEESSYEVQSRDPEELEIPKGAYAFYFSDREEEVKNNETLTGPFKNISKRHYIEGKVYSLDEIKILFPDKEILISNMEGSYSHVVRCKPGNFQPFEEGDVLWMPN